MDTKDELKVKTNLDEDDINFIKYISYFIISFPGVTNFLVSAVGVEDHKRYIDIIINGAKKSRFYNHDIRNLFLYYAESTKENFDISDLPEDIFRSISKLITEEKH